MNNQIKLDTSIIYGHCELMQFNKFENGLMVSYGYSINYDRNGIEISRTKPSRLSSIGWEPGKPKLSTFGLILCTWILVLMVIAIYMVIK